MDVVIIIAYLSQVVSKLLWKRMKLMAHFIVKVFVPFNFKPKILNEWDGTLRISRGQCIAQLSRRQQGNNLQFLAKICTKSRQLMIVCPILLTII
jgi:hypothetical protein